jgi:DNA (cytosine-5)-methyltransferase 1
VTLTYGSLFAGAGGFDLGFDAAGWSCAWQVENDPKAQQVLAQWWPDVTRYEDVTTADGAELAPVDVIAGGYPCQDLSVAGKRVGLDGARSGLFHEFVRIVEEMRSATGNAAPRWVVWENVPGLLSMPGALGSVLAAWEQAGAVVQEWRTVDTGRAFGVPQRRFRVLGVVGFDPGAERGPEILADPEGVRRDSGPCGAEGAHVAALTASGVGTCGADDNQAQAGHLIPLHANTLTARDAKGTPTRIDAGEGNLITFDTTQITSAAVNRSNPQPGDPSHPLAAAAHPPAIASELGVRRLTPTECERLMGWPDGHTAPAGADGPRYRLCGNGMAAPAAEWVARRITRADEGLS